jgi:AcrR family transcriptional regulator
MGRWEPDAPGRLQLAAMELYGQRGFEQTTVAEIAARAGVTERTFFRHFADKREVFFHGTGSFERLWTDTVAAAPADATPLEAGVAALDAASQLLDGRRELAAARQRILDANPELSERELAKLGRVRDGLTAALRERGAEPLQAALIAATVQSVFHVAFERWVYGDDPRELPAVAADALRETGELLQCSGLGPAPASRPARSAQPTEPPSTSRPRPYSNVT